TRIAMDLDVVVGEDRVSFEGFGLTGNLMGRLRIRDDLDTRGELSMLNGRYAAYGQRLSLRRARVLFAGPIDQPYLDIEAIREVEDVVAGLRLTGRADRPTTTVFAEPAMSQEQALSWLITGRPLGGAGGDNTMMARAALGLGLAGTAGITRDIGESLGIQDLKLETEGSGTDASVVASGYLTDRLSVRYGVGLFEPVTRVALRYDISRKLYLEAASGLASSLDLFYRRDF
ncbi:MAG: translocation/assembly module TamB domain-containing protein, partial [Gammaproteobacteria bacterium]|nr:translocation/assembly module TamB domain-containing protein [Gammaproteobacteria bacterium]